MSRSKFIAEALTHLPQELHPQITAALHKRWEKPLQEEMSLVLRRNVSVTKARQLLYAPDDECMRLYPALMEGAPAGAPEDHPQAKTQVAVMTAMYLVHQRKWELMQPFVEEGGLRVLVRMLQIRSSNDTSPTAAAKQQQQLYMTGQAMHLLHALTAEEPYPWFDPPLRCRHPQQASCREHSRSCASSRECCDWRQRRW
ncbi:MAG: hypothetical protein WDW36_004972 [Sanguina aurantia]